MLSSTEAQWDQSARLLLQLNHNNVAAAAFSSPHDTNGTGRSYSRFVASCYALFGYKDAPPFLQIRLIQQMLDLITGLLLYTVIFLMLNQTLLAWLISLIYMVHPAFRTVSAVLAADSWNAFLQVWVLCCFLLFFGSGKESKLVGLACGLTFGFGTLLSPPLLPFLLLFAGSAGIRCFYTRRYVGPYLMALVTCLLVLTPWWLHRFRPDQNRSIIVAEHKEAAAAPKHAQPLFRLHQSK